MGKLGNELGLDRRTFMAGVVATAVVAGCSGDDDDTGTATAGNGGTETGGPPAEDFGPLPRGLRAEDVPSTDSIYGWIEEVFGQGVRRPGYEADIWAESFVEDKFRELGLENVRMEPVPLTRWEPREWSLDVTNSSGETRSLDCFPLPYSAPIDGLEVELAALDPADPGAVAGKASLADETLLRLGSTFFVDTDATVTDKASRIFDPDGTFVDEQHVLPFSSSLQDVMEASIAAGAVAYIGALMDYPGDSFNYFVPYDGIERPIPGVWVNGPNGTWLHEQLAAGPVQIKLSIDSTSESFESHNVVGELPGADDEVVMVGSHHDAGWSSAVEDGSGISLVLAQATFWAAQPVSKRPHRMVFLLHAGHMCGGAGLKKYIEDHKSELDNVVLELHLEHAALDFVEDADGELVSADQNVPRWFFVSRIQQLEDAVMSAIQDEELARSMLMSPDVIGDQPPTDGAFYHNEGVPIAHFLEAPFYLFDEMDRLDKVDKEHLVPLTRWAIRVLQSTRGVSAADLRAEVRTA